MDGTRWQPSHRPPFSDSILLQHHILIWLQGQLRGKRYTGAAKSVEPGAVLQRGRYVIVNRAVLDVDNNYDIIRARCFFECNYIRVTINIERAGFYRLVCLPESYDLLINRYHVGVRRIIDRHIRKKVDAAGIPHFLAIVYQRYAVHKRG